MSLNFDRRKKVGSKPELPVLDSVPPSKIGAIYLSDASSPLSNYSEKTKEESKSNEIIPVSGEIHVQDVMVVTSLLSHSFSSLFFFGQTSHFLQSTFFYNYGLIQSNPISI